ncbi:MAG TPA: 16S rRNA (cytosine(1402)-N(4))-methyltransferase RsmH [Candidatus Enterenecus merdae]|nr:16S rRNA (cytosine(1402)-N(4))-methyltransferase RsmH [Candidatus Enterenecus merdae]
MDYTHKPVLLQECLEGLKLRPDGFYVDGTLGRAGHSRAIAAQLTTGRLICIDRDREALAAGEQRLADYRDRVELVHGNFGAVAAILAGLGVAEVDGMLFDLGVSSPQLDDGSRGFSYLQDAPLDMRMDQSAPLTAYEVVNGWGRDRLKEILWQYGEERYAGLIAGAIDRARGQAPIRTTGQLAQLVSQAMPAKARREKQHPAKRTFQAIRIAVNDELGEVERMLASALDLLRPGGRLAVISFHSLEDRLVKTTFAQWAKGCTCPPDFPVCVCGKQPRASLIGKRPITAGAAELAENPRARSAKLRVAEKR